MPIADLRFLDPCGVQCSAGPPKWRCVCFKFETSGNIALSHGRIGGVKNRTEITAGLPPRFAVAILARKHSQ